MEIGIAATGSYIPYYYISRADIGSAWDTRGQKGNRAMANADEDSVTMAVEAVMDVLHFMGREDVDELYFASTTAPYAEKSHATIVATASDLKKAIFTADFASSTKSGTDALRAAFNAVKACDGRNVLVAAADLRDAHPKSGQEQMLGDAAAAVAVSAKNLIARLDCMESLTNEITDIWRHTGDKFLRSAEARFALEKGYMSAMTKVVKGILAKAQLQPSDITKAVFTTPGMKEAASLAKKTGFLPEQLQDTLMGEVGDCGTAQPLLLLAAALEGADPGDKILLASYGSGANAFLFTVTDQIEKLKERSSVKRYLGSRKQFTSYNRFLSFRGIAEAEPGAPFKLPASTSMTWREQDVYLRLYASKCRKCGAGLFPINHICYKCGSVNEYDTVRASDRITKIFTFSVDNYAGRSDNPIEVQTVAEDEEQVRYYTIMTDFVPQEVTVGMPLEFTFRKMHTLGNFNNYFWKFRPVRRERV